MLLFDGYQNNAFGSGFLNKMIYYDSISSSPIGALLIGTSRKGLCAVVLGKGSFRAKKKILGSMFPSAKIRRDPAAVRKYRKAIENYLAGKTRQFNLPIDLSALGSSYQKRVLNACKKIPFGKTVSYGELARRVGSPRSARAIGGAMGRNPVPIVIPCHRVVTSSGALGGFSCGISFKKKLLALEGVPVRKGRLRGRSSR